MESLTLQFCVKEIENKDVFEGFLSDKVWKNLNGTIAKALKKKGGCVSFSVSIKCWAKFENSLLKMKEMKEQLPGFL